MLKIALSGVFLSFMLIGTSCAENISLRIVGRTDGAYAYYQELLQSSLIAAGHTPHITTIDDLPQKRWINKFEQGRIDLVALVESASRNEKYIPIEIAVSNNLIGQRILLIPKGAAGIYSKVNNLDDFRALNKSGGFGKNWFDISVWKANDLKFEAVDGEWRNIYNMLAKGNRNIDYFSRGVNEILAEAKQHPELEIEPRLILAYDRGVRFYLNQHSAHLKDALEASLLQAHHSGLIDAMVKKYYGQVFSDLNYETRLRLDLKTPK